MSSTPMKWTEFDSVAASTKTEHEQTWPELLKYVGAAGPYLEKSNAHLLKLATFSDSRTAYGSLRHNANVVQVTGLEGDYDGESMSIDDAIDRLQSHKIRAAVYPTPSHTPERPRWRVIAPLSTPVVIKERARLVARLNGALGGILANESFTPSQSYYFGKVEGKADYKVHVTFDDPEDGHCIDELHELDRIAICKATRPEAANDPGERKPVERDIFDRRVGELGRKLKTGDGRRELLKTWTASRSARGMDAENIKLQLHGIEALYFDPADPVDWGDIDAIVDSFKKKDMRDPVDMAGFLAKIEGSAAANDSNILPFGEFMRELVNPDYVWRGILRSGYLYALTASPGIGKTAVSLLLLLKMSLGLPIHGRQTKPCRALFLCGENPDDVRIRMDMLAGEHGVSEKDLEDRIFFTRRPFNIDDREQLARFVSEAVRHGPFDLVFIDTGPAHSGADDENDNRQMHVLATAMRELMEPIGKPCTIALMHPTKGAERDKLLPRGGGAFVGSIDGCLCLWRSTNTSPVELFSHQEKFRGQPFSGMNFELKSVEHPKLRDNFGNTAQTVIAVEVACTGANDEFGDLAADALLLQEDKRTLVRLLCDLYDRGEWVSSKDHSKNSAYSRLKDKPGFPRLSAQRTQQLVKGLRQDGLIAVEDYREGRHRNLRNRLIVTEAGRDFAGIALSALERVNAA